jgi:hypothetical protein
MKRNRMSMLVLFLLTLGVVPVFAATGFDGVLDHYEAVRTALLADSLAGVSGHAKAIVGLSKSAPADLAPQITAAASKLAAAKDLNAARDAFYELSKPLVRWREASGSRRHVVAYCPMVKRSWLQPKGEIGNPYYGKSMAKCGEVVSK